MALVYNVNKATRRYIGLELEIQRLVPEININEQFKKAVNEWIDENVPAYFRTEQNIRIEESERMLQLYLNDFLVKFAKNEIGYFYKKDGDSENLSVVKETGKSLMEKLSAKMEQ